jgi:hypothetical protein
MNRLMGILTANGIESCMNGLALLDHCLAVQEDKPNRKRG